MRTFTQDDAHIFVRPDQVKAEFENVIDIIQKVFAIFKFEDFEAQISLRDPKDTEKYIGSDEIWEESQNAIREACREKGLNAREEIGEAAFYGPKLDFMVKDAIGRKWQLGTIQVDYNLPQRFHLEYTAEDNSKQTPVMIHRAPFGSLERFTAVLIEHTAGHFPLWLTPDQVAILPISEKYNDYAEKLRKYFDRNNVRAYVDDRNEKIGRKIRDNDAEAVQPREITNRKQDNRFGRRLPERRTRTASTSRSPHPRCAWWATTWSSRRSMPIRDALRLADELELDLIEISPKAEPPVCRIADYQKVPLPAEEKRPKS